jgi:hypothetical protein
MVLDVVARLRASDKKVFVVVHDIRFMGYVKGLLDEQMPRKDWAHRVRFVDAKHNDQIDDQALHSVFMNPKSDMRIVRGIDNVDVFVDHTVWEMR